MRHDRSSRLWNSCPVSQSPAAFCTRQNASAKYLFSNFHFEETDLVVKFGSNMRKTEQVLFLWSNHLDFTGKDLVGRDSRGRRASLRRGSHSLDKSVDKCAVRGMSLSEFEIIWVRVETDEKDVNSMQQ